MGEFSKRGFLTLLAGASAQAACGAGPSTSKRPVIQDRSASGGNLSAQRIVANAQLGGAVGFAAVDLRTGNVIESANASRALPPASVAKAVTALYALETLGAGHRFSTRVIGTGRFENGVLTGDLILVGGGDPTLDTRDLQGLAAALKARGLREVRGDFKVAEGALPSIASIDPAQPAHLAYNPSISGIALNFNRVHFQWRRSGARYTTTVEARTAGLSPRAYTIGARIVDRDRPIFRYSSTARKEEWSVARSALGSGGSRALPVRKPALFAGDVFQTLARAQGIALKAPQIIRNAPSGLTLATHQSVPLREICKDMLEFSNNLTAEMIGLAATARRGSAARTLRASADQMNRWVETTLGISQINLLDHSGLNDRSRADASSMLAFFLKPETQRQLRSILRDIPMRDANRRIIPDHPVTVLAKTGTLNFVSALGGYASGQGGRDIAFAIFAADTRRRSQIPASEREAPQGARSWNRNARAMQQALIERWTSL